MDITTFGAVPDDNCSDQLTFEAAAAWFNGRHGQGELYIPRGTYILGRQDDAVPGVYLWGVPALVFFECENLIVRGDLDADRIPTTILKYDECLKFGAFDTVTGQRYLASCDLDCIMGPGEYFMAADIGACVNLNECGAGAPVTIMNLEIDGNAEALQLGGKFGEAGIQLRHDAIDIYNSRNVIVNRIKAHDLGRDGIMIGADPLYPYAEELEITIMNSSFNWNGRNGFSWVGGSRVTAKYCTFDLNSVGVIKSTPGSGLDIEVEGAPIREGYFLECEFKYNREHGVISDPNCLSLAESISNHKFERCTMVASEFGDALWPDAPALYFEGCGIHGMTVHIFDAEVTGNYADRCIFTDCDFSDSYMGQAVSSPSVAYPWLINTECATIDCGGSISEFQAGALEMTNCRLTTCGHLKPFRIFGGADPWHATLTDCTYHFDHDALNPGFGIVPGNLFWVNFTDFVVEFPTGYTPYPICNTLQAFYCNGAPNACTQMIDASYPAVIYSAPPQYQDPNIPSLPVCISCDDPLAEPCAGSPGGLECPPPNPYPCCGPCACNWIEPPIPCEELHE